MTNDSDSGNFRGLTGREGTSSSESARFHLTPEQFDRFAAFIRDQTGISMKPAKKQLLANRLKKRIRELDLPGFEDYWHLLQSRGRGTEEFREFAAAITTNETYFQRGTNHYDIIRRHVLPEFAAKKRFHIRLWSAGCSSGEEAWDLAMLLREETAATAFSYEISASDISETALQLARNGEYADRKILRLNAEQREKYFQPVESASSSLAFGRVILRVRPFLSDKVKFFRLNLWQDVYPAETDIIFCRNVLIYFDAETREKVIRGFYRSLKPGGYLFLGHSESLQLVSHEFNRVRFAEGICYQKRQYA